MSPPEVEQFEKEARRRGPTLARGGRFYHLTGDNSKGLAVDVLTGLSARVIAA
ncbi:MAG: hypothetical protein ACE5JN_15845 [Candidatus Methylomirabilia bacterium]